MPLQRGRTGVVAIGLPATSTFGGGGAASHILYCDGFAATNSMTFYNSASTATGRDIGLGLTSMDGGASFTLSGPLTDTAAAILLALALGVDTVTNPEGSAYLHALTPVDVATELKFASLYIKNVPMNDSSTAGSIYFSSVLIDSLTLSCTASDVWRWSATFVSGAAGANFTTDFSSLVFPSFPAFAFPRTQFIYSTTSPTNVASDGGTGFGTIAAFAGGTGNGWTNVDWSTALKAASLTITNGVQAIRGGGIASSSANNLVRTERSITASATFHYSHIDSNAMRSTINAEPGASRPFIIRNNSSTVISGTTAYSFELVVPRATVTSIASESTFGPRSVTENYTVYNSGTLSDMYGYVWNALSTDFA